MNSLLFCHFIFTQCRAILLFWYGLYSYLAINSNWAATHIFAGLTQWNDYGSLGALLDCIVMQGYTMIKSFSPDFAPECIGPVGTAFMYGLPTVPFNIVMTAVDLAGFLLAMAFIGVLSYELKGTGATNIGQGKYLQFSYRVQGNKTFKVLNWVCFFFIFIIFLDTIRFLVFAYSYGSAGYLINYCYFLLPTLLTLTYSAYSLGSTPTPAFFNFEDESFSKLQFSRGWRDVMTDNNAFGQSLGIALLLQKRGDATALEKMLDTTSMPDASTVSEVVSACDTTPKSSDTPLEASEKTPLMSSGKGSA